jgi:hypothetical protein
MGMFSKTKTYVESATVAINEELPDTVIQSVVTSVVQDRSISDDLIANSLNGLGAKSKTYYKYGRDRFIHGLPEGTTELRHANPSTVSIVLSFIEGEPAVVEYSIFSQADSYYFSESQHTKEVSSTDWLSDTQIKIHYVDNTTQTVTVPSTDRTKRYYHVRYTVQGVVKYFFYLGDDPTYESLLVDDSEPESLYFPVVPFIRDGVDLSDDSKKGTDLYKSCVGLCNRINIKYADIGANIQENPDIDGVDHAYMILAVPIQTEAKASQEYLFEYFYHLAQTQVYTKSDFDAWEINPSGILTPPPINIITIKETENNSGDLGNFHIELGFNYIETETVTGNLGKVKTVTRETVLNPRGETDTYAYETSYMIWRKQVTSTEYVELRVVGLKHINYIYGEHTIDTSLEDSLSEDNDDFNLPLQLTALNSLTLLRQTDLMNDAIRLCFNSIETVKLKWYQTGVFKALIIIVAAVITVWTAGSGGQALAWAMAITGSTSIALNFAVAVIITAAINVGIGNLLNQIGIDKIEILRLIYTAYQIYEGDFSELTGDLALLLVSGIKQGLDFYVKNRQYDIMSDYDQLKAEQEAQQAELDELIQTFPTDVYIDPMAFVDASGSLVGANESPEDYYNRTIHTGNVGALMISQIENFVASNIQLEGVSQLNALTIS